jgi:CBS-domain-containing membrane protein
MGRCRVGEVMTADVVSVAEDTPFRKIVDLIEERGISGLPVVDRSRRVVGVVSEADLLAKVEFAGTAAGPRLFEGHRSRAARGKAGGGVAAEVMTTPAVTVSPDVPVPAAVKLMASTGVKRLPVTDATGCLVGIVTRSDLVKVFLRSDEQIRADVAADLAQVPGLEPEEVRVEVADGVVVLTGEVPRLSLVSVTSRLAERVDGVVRVVNRLTHRYDDLRPAAITFP